MDPIMETAMWLTILTTFFIYAIVSREKVRTHEKRHELMKNGTWGQSPGRRSS
jgi:hypothetical protein